jgi:hypothetical protein
MLAAIENLGPKQNTCKSLILLMNKHKIPQYGKVG